MGFLVRKADAEPFWVDLFGGGILFAPIDRNLVRRARRKALASMGRDEHGPTEGDDAGGTDVLQQMEDLGDALSHAIILEGARDWRGAMQEADGAFVPLPFDRDALTDMLADPVYFDAIDAAYVLPYATREREKNASAASPNGTGEAATQGSDTASTAAKRKAPGGAKPVRTGRKPSKPRKPKASGTS